MMLLTLHNLHKAYTAPVLTGVSFDLHAGEVHALVGENGAGKSTLVKMIAGLVKADAGEMRLRGEPFSPANKTAAERAGIRLVLQELNLVPTLSVAENILLDRLPRNALGIVNRRRLNEEARAAMDLVGLEDVAPTQIAGALGIGQQQLVEIAASLVRRCDVLMLDEPTAALTARETNLLFAQMERLKGEGVGIIYISHRLEELQRIADRITVLRDGRMIATHQSSAVKIPQLVREMVGRELSEAVTRRDSRTDEVALRVVGLRAGDRVRDVNLEVRRGEILGLAGLMGAGRTETLRAIFGADTRVAGEIYLRGAAVRIDSPYDAVRQGLGFVTEDRKGQGLLLSQSVRANITLARLGALAWSGGVIDRARERATAGDAIKSLRVRCASTEQPVLHLSGGNQQKVIIARWLWRNAEVLLFDEPTRGIDVGAKFEIYALLAELAAQGKAIVVASSELEELMALCDRIAVLSAGRLTAVYARDEWSQEKIMNAALREHGNKQVTKKPSAGRKNDV